MKKIQQAVYDHIKPKEKPLSEKISDYEAGEYFVTAGIWRTLIMQIGGYADTFEIGIRRKSDGKFWLLQNEKWNHQSVQEVANMIATMLGDKTQCYDPDWMKEYLT